MLKENTLYEANNGRIVCIKCASQSVLATGKDRYGKKVKEISRSDPMVKDWMEQFEEPLKCEEGCTSY